jgi:hypothetical protein
MRNVVNIYMLCLAESLAHTLLWGAADAGEKLSLDYRRRSASAAGSRRRQSNQRYQQQCQKENQGQDLE